LYLFINITNFDKQQKQGTSCFQICTTEKLSFQSRGRKTGPFGLACTF
jgi:hypothetical protein